MLTLIGLIWFIGEGLTSGRIAVGDWVLWEREADTADGRGDRSAGVSGDDIRRLYLQRRSNVVVAAEGEVSRVLADDNQGSRHQRFVVELASGQTILVAHNIDLAPRVPVKRGDRVEIKGEYEWNDRGGVLHWTHRDPQGRHEGGWIRHRGEIYQ